MLPHTVTLMGLDKARSLRLELWVNQRASRLCLAALPEPMHPDTSWGSQLQQWLLPNSFFNSASSSLRCKTWSGLKASWPRGQARAVSTAWHIWVRGLTSRPRCH